MITHKKLDGGAEFPILPQMALKFPTWPFLPKREDPLPHEAIVVLRGIQESIQGLKVSFDQLELPWSGSGPAVDPRVDVLERKIGDLTLALSEGIQRVQRSENRVRHIVSGAKRELAEAGYSHPGLEAEASELEPLHGKASEEEEVSAVHASVAGNPPNPSPIRGVTVRQMRVARARRR